MDLADPVDTSESVADVGVPVGEVVLGHLVPQLEQLRHRRFFEDVEHPKTGVNTHAGMAVRWSSIPETCNQDPPRCSARTTTKCG